MRKLVACRPLGHIWNSLDIVLWSDARSFQLIHRNIRMRQDMYSQIIGTLRDDILHFLTVFSSSTGLLLKSGVYQKLLPEQSGKALKACITLCTHSIISFFASQYSIGEVIVVSL